MDLFGIGGFLKARAVDIGRFFVPKNDGSGRRSGGNQSRDVYRDPGRQIVDIHGRRPPSRGDRIAEGVFTTASVAFLGLDISNTVRNRGRY
jgi:hypothetical protein